MKLPDTVLNRKEYRISVEPTHIELLFRIADEMKLEGSLWSRNKDMVFRVVLSEDELLILKLRVPVCVVL